MQPRKSYNITETLYNKIISVAYKDGSLYDKLYVYYIINFNKEAKKLFYSFRETSKKVKSLEPDLFPDELIKKTERNTISLRLNKVSFLADFLLVITTRPVVSLATTLILLTVIISTFFVDKKIPQKYSDEEILKADRQARYALNIVNNIFSETNSTLKKDILTDRVAEPINNGVDIINNLFKEK